MSEAAIVRRGGSKAGCKLVSEVKHGDRKLISYSDSRNPVRSYSFGYETSYTIHCEYEYAQTLEDMGLSNTDFFVCSASAYIEYKYQNSKGSLLDTTQSVGTAATLENGTLYVRINEDVTLNGISGRNVHGPGELYVEITITAYTVTR